MKKIMFLFLILSSLAFAQKVVADNSNSTIWQDSLYVGGNTSDVINMGMNYKNVYIVGVDIASSHYDTTSIQSGTINYILGSDNAGNMKYLAHDTVWANIELDSVNTSTTITKVSNQIIFPTGTNEYFARDYGLQLLRIVLTNKATAKIYYHIRAAKL